MNRWELNTLLLLVLASLLLIFLDSRRVLDPAKSLVQVGLAPVEYGVYVARNNLADAFSFLTFWRSGEARIKNLEQRNLELVGQVNRLSTQEVENRQLRAQLGVRGLAGRTLLPAPVLGLGRYLIIGVGARDGVKENQSVVYLDNLVGQIAKVTPRLSYVSLPIDVGQKISVKIGLTGQVRGLVIGQFNSTMFLDQVAQNEDIKTDDLVVTSGQEQGYEPGLVVGKIVKITSLPTDLFKRAEVGPLIRYDRLTTVFVLLD